MTEYGEIQRRKREAAFSYIPMAGKYITAVLIIVFVVLMLRYASGSTKSFSEISEAVEASLDTETLVSQDGQALKRYYGLNSADYTGVLYYSSEFSISAEEVLLIEVKNESQVQEVRDAIEKRLENRINDFEGYAPEQVQILEAAQIQVRGRFIFVAVSENAEEYREAFTGSL